MEELKMSFLKIEFDVLDSRKYIDVMMSGKGVEMLYNILKRYIVRKPAANIYRQEVFNKYYLKGKLACAIGQAELVKILGVSKDTIQNNIKILEDAGFIKTDTLKNHIRNGANKRHRVFILGETKSELDGHKGIVDNEYYFLNQVLMDNKIENG
jgi:DNA-binding MarR family transcriptional regulator